MLLYISWENLSLYKKRILWPLHLPIPITFLLDNILHITRRPCIVASEVVHRRSLFNDLYLLVFPCFCKQYVYKLNIYICVFCKGMEFPFFQHLTVSWAVPVAKKIFLKKCYASEFRSKRRWNGSAQVELFRSKWSSDRSVRSDRKLPFHFQKFSFPVPLQLVTPHSSQNGGWFRWKCLLVQWV